MLKASVPAHMVGIRDRATFLELLGIGSDGFDCERYRNLHFAKVPFNPNHSERWPRKLRRDRDTILDTLSKARASLRKAAARGDAGLRDAALSRVVLNEARLAENATEAERQWTVAKLEADRIERAFKLWKGIITKHLSPINTEAACYFANQCYLRSTPKHERNRYVLRAAHQSRKRQPHDNPLRLDKIAVKGPPPPPTGFCFPNELTEWEPPANSIDRGMIMQRAALEREATAFLAAHPQSDTAAAEDEQALCENRTQATMRSWAIVFDVPHDRPFGPRARPQRPNSTCFSRTRTEASPHASRSQRRKLIEARTRTDGRVTREVRSPRDYPSAAPSLLIPGLHPVVEHQHDHHVVEWRLFRGFEAMRCCRADTGCRAVDDGVDFGGGLYYSGFSRGRGLRQNSKPD
jgi:hypothetical protein